MTNKSKQNGKRAFLISADALLGLSTVLALSLAMASGIFASQRYIGGSASHASKLLYLYAESQEISSIAGALNSSEISSVSYSLSSYSGVRIKLLSPKDAAPGGCGTEYICRAISVRGSVRILVVKYENENSNIS
ncbi:MAG: hypothetical protein ACP5K9_01535 [Candidatus Micrarchaeia archaeon]